MKAKRRHGQRRLGQRQKPSVAAREVRAKKPGAGAVKPPVKRRRLRRLVWLACALMLVGGYGVVGSYYSAAVSSHGRLFDDVSKVPARQVGLVFGCDDNIKGRDNLYFKYRIDAAVELWEAGKVKTLIVSGDNRSRFYNEPQKMKNALISRGVPAGRIVCDFAGLRTLDSVVRAKEVFGVSDAIFITQQFHNERAIYLALANGMDPVGYNAKAVGGASSSRMKLREVGARVKMGLDVHLLRTKPKHLGEREVLPD